MKTVQRISLVDQVVASLREGIQTGRWRGAMPGVIPLSVELGVSRDSMREALWRLEQEGWIASHGNGRRREVVERDEPAQEGRKLRIVILSYENLPDQFMHAGIQRYMREIEAAGHVCAVATESQASLRFRVSRIAALVEATPADAWVVLGARKDLLEWFAAQRVPAIAVGGQVSAVDLASVGMNVAPAVSEVTRRLIQTGHRRIVLAAPTCWRGSPPGMVVKAFTDALQSGGILPTTFHLPVWEADGDGFDRMLETSFRLTPPTALLVADAQSAVAALSFFARKGLRVPQDVSLVALCYDPCLGWCRPRIAQMGEGDDVARIVRRVVRWVEDLAKGAQDRKMVLLSPAFQQGESIGPVRRDTNQALVI